MHDTLPRLQAIDFPPVRRGRLRTLKANLGYRCNQSCLHCHVNAGPSRREQMNDVVIATVLDFLDRSGVETLDLTGGAPELHPRFRELVTGARTRGVVVIDRCNSLCCMSRGRKGLPNSWPGRASRSLRRCPVTSKRTSRPSAAPASMRPVSARLQRLNALGYGQPGSGLVLNLMYNPVGPVLPPAQAALEADYRRELRARAGVSFNRLHVLANMPIQRFGSTLVSRGQFDAYVGLLRAAHREENLDAVMCRSLLSVDWQGYVYDCDFNQMLGLSIDRGARCRLGDLMDRDMSGMPVRVAGHCYGCTAGQGSSCGGAIG